MQPGRSLKALFVDVAPARAASLTRVLDQAGWTVAAREASGADGLADALLEPGWDAVLYGGDGDGSGVPARKALALVRLADPHVPILAVSPTARPDDLATVAQSVEGIVFADPETLPARLDAELDAAARRRGAGVTQGLLHTQQSIADLVAAGLTPRELLERVLEVLGGGLGWAFGAVWQPDGAPSVLRPVATWHGAFATPEVARFARLTLQARFAPGRGLPGRVWGFRRPMWTGDVELGAATVRESHAVAAGLRCATAFPVVCGDECVAVVELWGHGKRESEPDVAALLAAVGRQLGHWFARERRMSAALEDERGHWREYVELTGALVAELDREGRIVHLSRSLGALLGDTGGALAGRDWLDITAPEHERAAARRAFEARLRGAGAGEEESPLRTVDGEERTIAWRHTTLHDPDGAIRGTLSSGQDVTGQRRIEEQIAYLAYHDALTGLPNRALLEDQLRLAVARGRRSGSGIAVLQLDLDGFKLVNDSLGHTTGDELLSLAAARLREALGVADLLARTGGDEFLVLLTDLHGDPQPIAEVVAARIVDALSVPFDLAGAEVRVGVSIGIASSPGDVADDGALLARADTAMYRAKASARGGWATFARDGRDPLRRLELSAAMRRALTAEELSLEYQPIHAVADRRLVALEALLRWDHPEHGPIPPSDFIPVAEETGLIEQLGDWVVRAVCEQQADWAARGLLPLISFNVAPRQLRRLDFTARIVEHLRATGADPTRLIVELTSSSLQEAADPAPILQELRALGLGLALDDFGAGSSSLAALRTLPFSALRIHRDLLRGVPEDPEAAELVSAVLRITNALGRDAVVEGVESEAQLAFLAAEGCPYAQGFLFSEPLPPEAAAALVEAVAAPAAR